MGIPFAIAGAWVYDWGKDRQRITGRYVDIRGEWELSVSRAGDEIATAYNERFLVKWQRDENFRGKIISPTGPEGAQIELRVTGKFVDTYHAVFQYDNVSRDISDAGVGIMKFRQDHKTGEGRSVNFGVSSNEQIDVLLFKIMRGSARG